MPRQKSKKSARTLTSVAVNIAQLRKDRGWTQTELARRLGTHLSNIARVETGVHKPSMEFIEKAREVFDVSAEELIGPRTLTSEQAEKERLVRLLRSTELDAMQSAAVEAMLLAFQRKQHAGLVLMPADWVGPQKDVGGNWKVKPEDIIVSRLGPKDRR